MIRPHCAVRFFYDFDRISDVLFWPEQFEKTNQTDREFIEIPIGIAFRLISISPSNSLHGEIKAQPV
jgi:hypothetical protein